MAAIPQPVPTMSEIRIIALDLDGTLLNSSKELTKDNAAALSRAAAKGIAVVPTTGRFFGGMPLCIRELPFLKYAITINGAQVYDIKKDRAVAKAEMSMPLSIKIMSFLDDYPVLYDCYQENWGYISEGFYSKIDEMVTDIHYQEMVRRLRTPVPELKDYLQHNGKSVQKIQLFTPDAGLRQHLLRLLPEQFPEAAISSASPINIEINAVNAHKGAAVGALADYLGIDISQTMAFGDGLNDLTMVRDAGVGVAMENACPEVKAVADYITVSCEKSGVAKALELLKII